LIDAAKNGGGRDNITCIVLRFVERAWMQKLMDSGPGKGIPKVQGSM
jgi:serine/threonine protein phosphatase PrpC